jgi:hypothetical protein
MPRNLSRCAHLYSHGFGLLAIGIPLLLLLLAVLALEPWRDQLPPWWQQLAKRPSWFWNAGIGLIIGPGAFVPIACWCLLQPGNAGS